MNARSGGAGNATACDAGPSVIGAQSSIARRLSIAGRQRCRNSKPKNVRARDAWDTNAHYSGSNCGEFHAMESNQMASQDVNPEAAKRNLTSISPFFIVKDLQTSIGHYIERFGFQLDFQGPPDDVYYGHVSRDEIGI